MPTIPPELSQPPLRDVIVAFWSHIPEILDDAPRLPLRHRVLPDGSADLILRYPLPRPGSTRQCSLALSGILSTCDVVTIPPRTALWGIQFRPGFLHSALRIRPFDLQPGGREAQMLSPCLATLAERLRMANSSQEAESCFVQGVAAIVGDALAAKSMRVAPFLPEALRLLEVNAGQVRMRALAQAVGLHERTLHRHLSESLGMSPKMYARILRFQDVVARLREDESGEADGLARIALECGYFDQAHMTRDFRSFAGVTPLAFRE